MRTFRLTLEYDGTDFEGWQRQSQGHRTVQGCLESALTRITGAVVTVVGAGRTDAGVHAEGQVASARVPTHLEAETLQRSLNAVLPRDVAVVELASAPAGFDARRDARAKLYVYRIWNGPVRSPLRERRSHWLSRPLDLAAMAEGARALVGRHDFASFQTSGSEVGSTERCLHRVEVRGRSGDAVHVAVEGSGFLRHMVRALVGTLVEVGRQQRDAASLAALLAARSRAAAGPNAPARGLSLVRVDYGISRDPGDLGDHALDGAGGLG